MRCLREATAAFACRYFGERPSRLNLYRLGGGLRGGAGDGDHLMVALGLLAGRPGHAVPHRAVLGLHPRAGLLLLGSPPREIAERCGLTMEALGERVERIIAMTTAAHGPGVTYDAST